MATSLSTSVWIRALIGGMLAGFCALMAGIYLFPSSEGLGEAVLYASAITVSGITSLGIATLVAGLPARKLILAFWLGCLGMLFLLAVLLVIALIVLGNAASGMEGF